MKGIGNRERSKGRSKRKRTGLALLAALAMVAAITVFAGTAGAVGNFFELDGNATDATTGMPDDWSSITGAIDSALVTDETGDDDDVFTGGSSKDDLPIQNSPKGWLWKTAEANPEKNDIAHAYAAAYADSNGDLILYFGQDRSPDQDGNANVGFWFFQDDVGPNSDGSFSGTHQLNDIFVVAELVNGGAVPQIQVYAWNGSGLTKIKDQTNATCVGGVLSGDVCGIANAGPVTVPGGASVPSPYFFEGGMNVTKLLGGTTPCFGSFLANTRVSQSTDAVLTDFAGGEIDTCAKLTIKKETVPTGGQGFQFTTTGTGLSGFTLGDTGEKVFEKLLPGSYSVTETAPGDPWVFDSLKNCTASAGSSITPDAQNPAKIDIVLKLGATATCTYVNKRKPQVKLVKEWGGTASTVDLKFGETVKGTFSANGDTGFFTVDAGGPYTASEVFTAADGNLYDTTSKCEKNGASGSFTSGLSKEFSVANGDTVVCTFKNVRKTVKVKTIKDFVGTPASISIAAGGTSKAITGDDSVEATVEAGKTYTFSETLSDAQKALYTTTVQCTGEGQSTPSVYSKDIAVGTTDVTCTFVNTRKTGSIEVNKDFVGTGKPVTLRRDSTDITTTSVDYDGSPVTVDTGVYTVSEVFVTSSDADLFDKDIRCYKSGQQVPAFQSGTSQQVTVGAGESWVCDLRNTHKKVNVTVVKQYVGTPTTVELYVGATKANVSTAGGSVSAQIEAGSNVTVGETTVPTNYDAFIKCGNDAYAAGSSKALTNVTSDVTCTVENREKPKVKVTKDLNPASDTGRFDLKIGGTTFKSAAGDGDHTGFQYVSPNQSLAISEVGNVADLSKYTSSVDCGNKGSSQTTSLNIAVTYGDVVECTITNTRNTGSVTVIKKYVGDPTAVTLIIGAGTKSVSTDGASFTESLNTGTVVTVGEQSVPAGYDAFIKCGNDEYAAGSTKEITVSDAGTTCTVENRQKPIVTVTKQISPESDPGKFNLLVNGEIEKADAVDNQGTGNVVVSPGAVTVSETAGTGTSLSGYSAQITCDANKGDGTAGATSHGFTVAYGDKVNCTITNTRNTGKLRIDKDFVGQETGNKPVTLKRGETVTAQSITVDHTGTEATLPTGSYTASETFASQADANLYTSEYRCYDVNAEGYNQNNKPAFTSGTSQAVDVTSGSFWICEFRNTRKASSIEVTKVVKTPASQPEPGTEAFTFEVKVKNTSAADTITIDEESFEDFVDTDNTVNGSGTGASAITILSLSCDDYTIAAGATATCEFTAFVPGAGSLEPGDYYDYVIVTGTDQTGREVSDSDDEKVTIMDVEPTITVTKVVTGTASREVPGGSFTYSVTIVNNSLVEDVTITDIDDYVDTDGTLNGTGTQGAVITMTGSSCEPSFTIAAGGSRVCTFSATVTGAAGTYYDVIVVRGYDNEENSVTEDDDASVTLTSTPPPPPPPPPDPKIDVQVIKDATAQVTLGSNGTAQITYNVLVKNNGPNMANNVTLADAAPSGVVFNAITKQPDFGSCTISAALLQCNLGSMGLGVQTLITFTATVNRTGTIVNEGLGTGSGGPDTNPGNNRDDAQTIVLAPFNPPVVKPPKPPAPAPEICNTITVTQKMLQASGKKQVIRAVVVQGKKKVAGARVTILGPGIKLTVKTNKAGVAVATVTPKKAGIIRVSITNKKACNTQRIGVVGVFEPPVTG